MSDALYGAFGSLNTREFDFIFYLYGTKYNEGDGEENLWGLAPFGFLFSGVLRSPQSQPPSWLLQTKVFVSTLAQNFVDEFKDGGCVAQFFDELTGAQAEDAGPPGAAPEDLIRSAGQAGAATYVVTQGLSYPLKSSVYRSILGWTETAAGAATLLPLIYEEGKALNNERKSFAAGTCQ